MTTKATGEKEKEKDPRKALEKKKQTPTQLPGKARGVIKIILDFPSPIFPLKIKK